MASDVLLSVCLILTLSVYVGSDEALYSSDDPLSILNVHNFYQVIPGRDHVWFVEFYSSWCGHCIRFAPEWRQLAREVRAWKPVIQLAVVDCAQEENLKLCRDFSVDSYPTLKWIDAFSEPGARGVTYEGPRGTKDLKHAMIEHLQNLTGAPSAPKLLPNLAPLRFLEDIWNDVRTSTLFTAVIFEETHSYLGRELLLDFASRSDLVLRRMTKEHITKFGIKEFPSLFLIKRLGTFESVAQKTDREGFVKALNTLLGIREEETVRDEEERYEKNSNLTQSRLDSNKYVYMTDLLSGLHYSLRQEVAGHEVISGDKLEALKTYIKVLAKYFPGRKSVMTYLKQVSSWIQTEDGPLTGAGWLKQLNHLQEEEGVLGTEVEWRGCQGSVPKYRGYPCSLWVLFHTLTVNSVLQAGYSPRFNHLEVLSAMKEYISKFFGCRECSKHFMKMARTIEEEVTSPDESIMWLWRAHNKANARLHGDLTEDPAHPKLQFPPASLCKECHQTQAGQNSFNEKQVLIFLKKHFSLENILRRRRETDKVGSESQHAALQDKEVLRSKRKVDLNSFASKRNQKQLLKRSREKEEGDNRIRRLRSEELGSRSHSRSVFTHWGLNSLDISLCVLFYIVSCGIIILVYCHLSHNHRANIKHCTKGLC